MSFKPWTENECVIDGNTARDDDELTRAKRGELGDWTECQVGEMNRKFFLPR